MSGNGKSLFDLVAGFLTEYLPKNRCYSPNTVRSYRDAINLYRAFLLEEHGKPFSKMEFGDFSHGRVLEFLGWLERVRGASPSTRNQRLAAIKSFLSYCAWEDPALMAVYVDVSRARSVKVRDRTRPELSEAAVSALLSAPDLSRATERRNRAFMVLLYDTGARVGELLGADVSDLALDYETPCIQLHGKGRKDRLVPLSRRATEHLEGYLAEFHPEYPGSSGSLFYVEAKGLRRPMSQDTVARFLAIYARRARESEPQVPERVHAHMFRRARATHLYRSGVPLSYVQRFLGHESIDTTSVYATANLDMLKEAIERAESAQNLVVDDIPSWHDDESRLLELCGLQ